MEYSPVYVAFEVWDGRGQVGDLDEAKERGASSHSGLRTRRIIIDPR